MALEFFHDANMLRLRDNYRWKFEAYVNYYFINCFMYAPPKIYWEAKNEGEKHGKETETPKRTARETGFLLIWSPELNSYRSAVLATHQNASKTEGQTHFLCLTLLVGRKKSQMLLCEFIIILFKGKPMKILSVAHLMRCTLVKSRHLLKTS